jgi:PAS domain S-box-containing protein
MSDELYSLKAVIRFNQPDASMANDLTEIINLASQICNAPIAAITIIDEDLQLVRSIKNNELICSDRETSFCNHTIKQNGLMIINDTHLDDRFANYPTVTGAPFVRFYAGVTLTTKDGFAIGSFCVADSTPRQLTDHQQNSLKILAKQVMNLMELNWTVRSIEAQHEHTRTQKAIIEDSQLKLNAIFNSSRHTHILVNHKLDVVAFNKASAAFVKYVYNKTIKTGTSVLEYADPHTTDAFASHFNNAFTGNTVKLEWHMRPGTPYDAWKELEFVPIRDETEKIIGVALNSSDITERKLQQEQINIQNAALTRIAIIQSHEIRRPVASLLGIMALMKLEKTKEKLEYLDMLELIVQELDGKIRGIVEDSENTINNHLSIVA